MTARDVPKLRVDGMVSCRPTDAELRAAETELGRALPATYREFASAYGFGRSLGLFLFYVPCEPPVGAAWQETLGGRAHDLLKELAELLQRALEPNTGGVLLGAEFSLEPSFEPLPCFG